LPWSRRDGFYPGLKHAAGGPDSDLKNTWSRHPMLPPQTISSSPDMPIPLSRYAPFSLWEMLHEPIRGTHGDGFQRARFIKQMGCAGNDIEPLFAMQVGVGRSIQLDDNIIETADDQECRRPNFFQRLPASHVRSAATRNH